MINYSHIPVLLTESIEYLVNDFHGTYVDGTVGGAGHAEAVLEKIFPHGHLIGIDADADACRTASKRLEHFGSHAMIVHNSAVHIRKIIETHAPSPVKGIMFDLGVSSYQIDEPSKGFSFRSDERLDMRMNVNQTADAFFVVNSYPEEEIARIIREFGEERHARRIAKEIVARREKSPIRTTFELTGIVQKIVPGKFSTKSTARVFQAIRIEVNKELDALRTMVEEGIAALDHGGRIAVISYHSLEDRIVKNIFQRDSADRIPSGHKLAADTAITPVLRLLNKKVITASSEEQNSNPRSRSAKLRAAEKI